MNEYIRPNKAFRKISGCSMLGNVTYIFGVTCFGKTELIKQFFADTEYFYTTCMEHEWEESEIPEYSEQRAKTGNLYPIVIDDLHRLWNVEKRQAVIDLANRDDIWLILISRSNIPSWLQDSYLRRNYVIISENELGIDRYDIEKYLDENDIIIEPERIEWMIKTLLTNGFAIKQAIVNHVNGLNVDLEMCKKIGQDYIRSLNERVMIWLPNDVKDFLLKISLADSFNIELAKFLTGDRNVADLILKTVESGNFLYKQDDEYFLRSQMKKFLLNELHKKYSEDVINDHLRKIALYYELNNNEEKAFECYAKCHDTEKISSILCRVSQNTPETSYYYEMRKYYLMLSEREIESQICLMSTMAMLHSVMMDVEKSEYWYEKMKERLLIAKGEEKRELTARLAYLDLALPHRGSMNAFEIIKKSITLLKEKSIPFPEFSVTSNLPSIMNGGKDFCDWSKKDKELAKTFGKAISAFLGAHGKGFVKIALAESMYEKCGDSYEISELISGARNEIESGGGKYTMLFVAAALQTKQYIMDGDINEATALISAFRQRTLKTPYASNMLPNIDALICRIYLYEGNTKKIEEWMDFRAPDEDDFFVMHRYRYLTKIRCYMAEERYAPAIALIGRLKNYAQFCDRKYIAMECEILLSIIKFRRHDEWKDGFKSVLKTISEYNFISIIAEHGPAVYPMLSEISKEMLADKDIKDWFKKVMNITLRFQLNYPVYLKTTLKERPKLGWTAIEVLRYQAAGLSTREIAEMLGITERTVKFHASETYQKLGVKNKTEAVLEAKNLHII